MNTFAVIAVASIVGAMIGSLWRAWRSCPEKWKQEDYNPPPTLVLQLKRDHCLLKRRLNEDE